MHYLIARWNDLENKYEIIFYTHNYDEFEKIRKKFPNDIHLVDVQHITFVQAKEEVKQFVASLK